MSWSGTAKGHDQFFSDRNCMQLYRNTVATIINRVNTINGRRSVPHQSCAGMLGRTAVTIISRQWQHRRSCLQGDTALPHALRVSQSRTCLWFVLAKYTFKGRWCSHFWLYTRRYRDDPTIFAWNLINEPRCQKCVPLGYSRLLTPSDHVSVTWLAQWNTLSTDGHEMHEACKFRMHCLLKRADKVWLGRSSVATLESQSDGE